MRICCPVSVFTVPWPEAFTGLTGALRALNADFMALFGGLACTLQSDFTSAFVEHMLVLPAVLLICLLAYGCAAKFAVESKGAKVKSKGGAKVWETADGKTCTRATMKPRVF